MKIHLKFGWKTKVSAIKPNVYPLGIKVKWLVNKTFDKIQRFSHLNYTNSYTLFSFPVFVFYKTNAKGEKKRHALLNIYKLNELVILDTYPLFLQLDIIISVQGCPNLDVLDATLFFY